MQMEFAIQEMILELGVSHPPAREALLKIAKRWTDERDALRLKYRTDKN